MSIFPTRKSNVANISSALPNAKQKNRPRLGTETFLLSARILDMLLGTNRTRYALGSALEELKSVHTVIPIASTVTRSAVERTARGLRREHSAPTLTRCYGLRDLHYDGS